MKALVTAEIVKLVRQPALLFFGFLSVAFLSILFKFGMEGFVYLRTGRRSAGDLDIFLSAANSLGISGNSMGHLLHAIGIGSIFYLDYRYQTWRLLVPRHSRAELYAAKFFVCIGFLAAGLLLAVAGDLVLTVIRALASEAGMSGLTVSASSFLVLLTALSVALLELAVLTAFVAVVVVITRTMITAAISAFLLAIGSSILQIYLGRDADSLPLPSYAAQAARDWLLSGGSTMAGGLGVIVLMLWLAVLPALGMAILSRQQLATE
ncbi:hypothetical protein [Rhizobium sp. AAP43]|uniref:hypothetical protein n=1 Tax=Rhizobium sp. AAP43 TaxID=1523420 RepID=UPI0006B8D754|nr:hypothetical protein [Rhizobium sp. AAP43]KPF46401.1 hypothetical protein IP76_05835 [Rhizobium sp. AAP43]